MLAVFVPLRFFRNWLQIHKYQSIVKVQLIHLYDLLLFIEYTLWDLLSVVLGSCRRWIMIGYQSHPNLYLRTTLYSSPLVKGTTTFSWVLMNSIAMTLSDAKPLIDLVLTYIYIYICFSIMLCIVILSLVVQLSQWTTIAVRGLPTTCVACISLFNHSTSVPVVSNAHNPA